MSVSRKNAAIARMLNPHSLAIVGASDRQPNLLQLAKDNEALGVTVHLVNPRYASVYGRKAFSSLEEIGEPIDTVLSVVNAELSLEVIESAATLDVGGVVLSAAGFGEAGQSGREKQDRISKIAGDNDIAVCGPNCLGFINATTGKTLYYGPHDPVRAGGLAVISQSGGLLHGAITAGTQRRLGFSYLISSGNEAATDLVDYLDVLIDDPSVTAVAMVVEEIRRPHEFMEVAYKARSANKPLLALKLGRSEAGQRMGASHTGAMMGDARDYDAAFRQTGVAIARDLDDLFDQAMLFSSLTPARWRSGQSIGVLTASGGDASLVSDAFEVESLPLPVDEELAAWTNQLVPTNALGNPFDITGILYNEEAFSKVLDMYRESNTYDTIFVPTILGPEDEAFSSPLVNPMKNSAPSSDQRLIVASASASALGGWTTSLVDAGVGVGRGIAPTVRSLRAMDRFVRIQGRSKPNTVPTLDRPPHIRSVRDGEHELLQFEDAAELAASFGVPVAPYALATPKSDVNQLLATLPAAERYVVKLANSMHRTELGAVVRGVNVGDVPDAVTRMAKIGEKHSLSTDVVIQPDVSGHGEAFIGAHMGSEFGPTVLFGLGGIFVEAMGDISSRIAPFGEDDARDMLGEIRGAAVLNGLRGKPAWNMDTLAQTLVGVGQLAEATKGWLESIELNPLIVTDGGFAAVDLSCVVRPSVG